MCPPPKLKQSLWKLVTPPNSTVKNCAQRLHRNIHGTRNHVLKSNRAVPYAFSTWQQEHHGYGGNKHELMKNRKDEEMIHAYNALLLQLKWAGIVPKKHVLDNKVSDNITNHIRDMCKFDMELVPPGCHRYNAAEVAIHNFKAHFISVLVGVADDIPPSLWYRLPPQTEVTINLIWKSNDTPNVLA
jgi:hypothetical protein